MKTWPFPPAKDTKSRTRSGLLCLFTLTLYFCPARLPEWWLTFWSLWSSARVTTSFLGHTGTHVPRLLSLVTAKLNILFLTFPDNRASLKGCKTNKVTHQLISHQINDQNNPIYTSVQNNSNMSAQTATEDVGSIPSILLKCVLREPQS